MTENGNTLCDLIEALTIFAQYGNPTYPTHCEHDVMSICNIDPADVSDEHKAELDKLGFFVNEEYDCFQTLRFGSG